MQFVGPAHQIFASFPELSIYSLDTYWPNWRRRDAPGNYILAPIFSYKHPDFSDQRISEHIANEFNREKIDRDSDSAEHVIYRAANQLIEEQYRPPILVIHGVDLDKRRGVFGSLFPRIDKTELERFKPVFREYDFILMGPKIGILVIEVKGSHFSKCRDFSDKCQQLPEHIMHGVDQLQSIDLFLDFVKMCTGVSTPVDAIHRVLFTPNLNRNRFTFWHSTLDDIRRNIIDQKVGRIEHWFHEDMTNLEEDSHKPPLYTKLKQVLDSRTGIPFEMYEAWGPFVAGISSTLVNKGDKYICLEELKLSTNAAISHEAERLDSQDPAPTPATSPKRFKRTEPLTSVTHFSKVIILTPEQQNVLNGPKRQLIIGPAGTGKTIILQERALQLLHKGESVIVFATQNYVRRYEELFESYGLEKYQVQEWCQIVKPVWDSISKHMADNESCLNLTTMQDMQGAFPFNVPLYFSSVWSKIQNCIPKLKPVQEFDNVIIDDALDIPLEESGNKFDYQFGSLFAALWLLKTEHIPWSSVWIALDTFILQDFKESVAFSLFNTTVARLLENAEKTQFDGCYSVKKLSSVMRCSENVYRMAYKLQARLQMKVKPTLGHKLQGPEPTAKRIFTRTLDEAATEIWDITKFELDKLQTHGISLKNIAIIIGENNGQASKAVWRFWPYVRPSDDYEQITIFSNILEKCKQCGIPVATITKHQQNLYSSNETLYELLDHATNEEALTIGYWNGVSSLEWPIVIYITLINREQQALKRDWKNTLNEYNYWTYRACSRATVKLIEIIATFGEFKHDEQFTGHEVDVYTADHGRYICNYGTTNKDVAQLARTGGTLKQLELFEQTHGHLINQFVRLQNQGDDIDGREWLTEFQEILLEKTRRRHHSVYDFGFTKVSPEEQDYLRQSRLW